MKTVTVSSKFQIVIPREARQALGIQPGLKFQVLQYENRLELIPVQSPQSRRGFLRGINTDVHRDDDRC